MSPDTIAAIATPPGMGGVGIVRVSGPDATGIAMVLCGSLPAPRCAALRPFLDASGEPIDHGLVLCFPAPGSFTGEDVVELHGHGGPVVMNLLLRRILELGARAARPGEFSERAFLNDRIDLTQAEAIADLIGASTEAAARAATRSLDGALSKAVKAFQGALTEQRVYIEAAIDFPDEDIDFLADGQVAERNRALLDQLDDLLDASRQGRLLRDGLTMALAGRPNAGKSSLLNALAGRDSAIVTPVPGTTRDVLREQIQLDGIPLHLVDTAGLRESEDLVEREGVRRARRALEDADHILLVVDDSEGGTPVFPELVGRRNLTIVRNKIDLSGAPARVEDSDPAVVWCSAKTGEGLDLLRTHIKRTAAAEEHLEGAFMARERHLDALRRARGAIERSCACLEEHHAGELAAEELRIAQRHLSEITGEFGADDLLGAIFSSFCIGK